MEMKIGKIHNIYIIRCKVIASILVLATIFHSCSGERDENIVPDVPGTPAKSIGFMGETPSVENFTRAGYVGLENLVNNFKVWGSKTMGGNATDGFSDMQHVMQGYKVLWKENTAGSTVTNTADWEYVGIYNSDLALGQTVKYWDFSASSYRFYGMAPYGDSKPTISADGSTASFSYQYDFADQATSASIPYYSDLWISDNGRTALPPSTALSPGYATDVCLTFHSPITRVRFAFRYPDDIDPQRVNIRNVSFADSRWTDSSDPALVTTPVKATLGIRYPLTGTVTEASTQWTGITGGRLKMTIPYEETPIHVGADDTKKWYYVLPLSKIPGYDDNGTPDDTSDDMGYSLSTPYEQGSYTLTARINGKVKTATVPAELLQWKEGFSYTYYFKITDVGITFDHYVEVYTHWKAGVSEDTEW